MGQRETELGKGCRTDKCGGMLGLVDSEADDVLEPGSVGGAKRTGGVGIIELIPIIEVIPIMAGLNIPRGGIGGKGGIDNIGACEHRDMFGGMAGTEASFVSPSSIGSVCAWAELINSVKEGIPSSPAINDFSANYDHNIQ